MKISDVMTRQVEIIHPDSSVREAAQKMRDLDVGLIPVCDGTRLVGMISDRDITLRATAEGKDPAQTSVRDVMSPKVFYCYEDENVQEAAQIMGEQQIRRLPIINRDKKLVGIVSLGDISVDVENNRLSGKTLEQVSMPSRPERKE